MKITQSDKRKILDGLKIKDLLIVKKGDLQFCVSRTKIAPMEIPTITMEDLLHISDIKTIEIIGLFQKYFGEVEVIW